MKNPDTMTPSERLDWILDDPLGGEHIAALPITDDDTIRRAVRHSIETNGMEQTGEHWAAVLDAIGPMPSVYLDSVKLIFNQEIAGCF